MGGADPNRDDAAERWQAALEEMSVWYQPTADGRPFALRQRARAGTAEAKRVVARTGAC